MVILVNMKFRTEFDSLGKVKVPSDKYWGASTQRSNKHFDIGDFLVRPIVIKSIGMIKKAAAIVNTKNGDLDKKISKIIIKVANEIISGKHKILSTLYALRESWSEKSTGQLQPKLWDLRFNEKLIHN